MTGGAEALAVAGVFFDNSIMEWKGYVGGVPVAGGFFRGISGVWGAWFGWV
jgi:hypothetical protein